MYPACALLLVCLTAPSSIDEGLDAFAQLGPENSTRAERQKSFRALLAREAVRKPLAELIDRRLGELEADYAKCLDPIVREAYRNRLESLTSKERYEVAMTRRVWRTYLLQTTTQFQFQQYFLKPAADVGKLLLPDVERLATKESAALLRVLREFDGYREEVRTALDLGDDPTTGVVASTGVAFPALTKVRSFDAQIDYLQRSIAVASSVAPVEAWPILIGNAALAREIDYEEAEFVLFANEVRMLMGTIAWAVDVAACACTRDHSKDRAEGRAKGHWSSVPGKKGMRDRLRRFGTSARSEGAGGGKNGRGYLRGLSYGGGHTGPLYSLKRNVVGVGRFGNVYTSVYRGDGNLIHPCQATDNELFLPPGITQRDIGHKDLLAIYSKLQARDFVAASQLVKSAKVTTRFDKMLLGYFKTMLRVEADWLIERLTRVQAAGDPFTVDYWITEARKHWGTILDKQFARFEKQLRGKTAARRLAAGKAYAEACERGDGAIREFITAHPKSVYAEAAKTYLAADKKSRHPLQWFLTVDKHLNRFDYLADGN